MMVCKAKLLVDPKAYCPGITKYRRISPMPKSGYRKNIMSVRRSIGPKLPRRASSIRLSSCFEADNLPVSHDGTMKPLSVSSRLHLSDDHAILH